VKFKLTPVGSCTHPTCDAEVFAELRRHSDVVLCADCEGRYVEYLARAAREGKLPPWHPDAGKEGMVL
jgi:hypothetical protein